MTAADDDLIEDIGAPDQVDDVDVTQDPFAVPPDGGPMAPGEEADVPVADGGLFPGLPCCCEAAIPSDLGFEPVDPETVTVDPTADTIIGDPVTDAEYWMYQGEGNGTCAPTSVAMMLSDVLGVTMSNEVIVQRAIELGVLEHDPTAEGLAAWSGMNDAGIMILAESFGLDVNLRYGELDDLAAYLEAGHAVTVGLDADEIWYGEDDSQDQGYGGNHQVVVTGIDPVNGLVYLNDSGVEEGAASVIPLDQFTDAWADCANSMIVTDLPGDQAAATVDVADLAGEGDGQPVLDRIVPVDANYFIEPGDDLQSPEIGTAAPVEADAAADGPAITLDRTRIEAPDPATDGVQQLLILPFTFIARFADRVL